MYHPILIFLVYTLGRQQLFDLPLSVVLLRCLLSTNNIDESYVVQFFPRARIYAFSCINTLKNESSPM